MGWTVLYIAFGIVALWLLGEVLLQYKARLRWRLLAFAGFMCVVLGVLMPSVFVIALGAIAFAAGQTYVTLSFRRGFSTGWAIGGSPGASRRRRAGSGPAAEREPSLEVSDLEYEPAAPAAQPASVYEPEPLPDDTGQYGVYNDAPHEPSQPPRQDEYGNAGYHAYPGYEEQAGRETYAAQDAYASQDAYHSGQHTYQGQDAYAAQDGYANQYDYGNGQQQYAAYSDPYVGSANGGQEYGSYDGGQQYADPYGGQQYGAETPPGGVWVPQQRDGEQSPPIPQEQPQRYDYDPGYNDQQYRY
ncbi:hypothetical protein [Streptomyces sp. AK02-01A]|uniref:hypothetical protein n=1 Tax=Streptomyces sp. AK02-01A TaxID=3028648 RepID=UPI0029B99847|nr:hypothetical protein [Streptomyces sp. AK02-01A]MDX3852883.1 hypothetical protein [Streptomyces sp. AK02-01A]